MILDYITLRLIWWMLLGVLLIGFAIMDGFDLGAAILMPFLGKTDSEKRVIINTVGPVWEGNQVWFILGGGAIFAAWPLLYAVSFSGFYYAMLLVLAGFILRPVGFKYRSKLENPKWRQAWDVAIFLGGFIPALIFGVAMGNVLQGVPFHFDETLRSFYTGSFWALLNPFALLSGVLSVCLLAMHGAYYLVVKTQDPIAGRAVNTARLLSILVVTLFIIAGIWVAKDISGYVITKTLALDAPSNPLYKSVEPVIGGWLYNYQNHPLLLSAPLLGILSPILAMIFVRIWPKLSFVFSATTVFGVIATVGWSMYPFLLPSSSDPQASLTVWDASSSQMTLFIMLIATIIFLPIVLSYTAWVYRVLRGKVTEEAVNQAGKDYY